MSLTTLSLQTAPRPRQVGRSFRPLSGNAYRVLGLPASASQREIHEAAARLRRAHKLGVSPAQPGDLPWLGEVRRNEGDLRDAVGRLASPAQRIQERLFWFGSRVDLAPVNSFKALDAALENLLAGGVGAAARHDAALLSLAVAYGLDAGLREEGAWVRALALWREVFDSDEFWSGLLAADLKGDFEPLVTHGEVRELRRRTLWLVTAPLVGVAKDAVAHDRLGTCRRALAILRAAPLPESLLSEHENDILGPVEDRFESACSDVFWRVKNFSRELRDNPAGKGLADLLAAQYDKFVRPRLREIHEVAGRRSFVARRAFEAAAAGLADTAAAYLSAGESALASKVRRKAWALSPPGGAALLQVEEDMRAAGDAAGAGGERTEDEYFANLDRELRESLGVVFEPPSPPSSPIAEQWPASSFDFSSCLAILLLIVIGAMCSWCGGGRSSRRSGVTLPPRTYNFNYNAAPPRLDIPPVDLKKYMLRVGPAELQRMMKRKAVVVLDVRTRDEYNAGHIPGAINVPEDEVEGRAAKLSRGKHLVAYCDRPAEDASRGALVKLLKKDFWNVAVLEGGYRAWVEAGLPSARTQGGGVIRRNRSR